MMPCTADNIQKPHWYCEVHHIITIFAICTTLHSINQSCDNSCCSDLPKVWQILQMSLQERLILKHDWIVIHVASRPVGRHHTHQGCWLSRCVSYHLMCLHVITQWCHAQLVTYKNHIDIGRYITSSQFLQFAQPSTPSIKVATTRVARTSPRFDRYSKCLFRRG